MKTALFLAITQRVVVISYRRFGTTCRIHLRFLTHDSGTDRLFRNVGKELPLHSA